MMSKCFSRQILATLPLLVCAAASAVDYVRDVQYSRPHGVPRERAAGRTFVYTEWAPYDIMSNFMNYWIDRPLLQDTSLRGRPEAFASLRAAGASGALPGCDAGGATGFGWFDSASDRYRQPGLRKSVGGDGL